jgi:hypothetical protein
MNTLLEHRIKEFLDSNYGGRFLLEIDNEIKVYENSEEILPALVDRFNWVAIDHGDERFNNNPLALFEYCLTKNDFGDICTLYYEDNGGFYIDMQSNW